MALNNTRLMPLHEADGKDSIRVLVAGDQNFYDNASAALDTDEISLIECAKTGEALIDKLDRAGFDCVVIDHSLGRQSSFALYETIAGRFLNPPPLVMSVAQTDARLAIDAFRQGFGDYVARDQNYARELVRAVRRAVTRSRKTQRLLDEVEYLSRMAKYDRLTGLPNRSFLEDRVASLIATGERHGSAFSLFLIDVNNFRQINDIHGHAVGDQALKAFARQLMLTARSSDSLGRFGGDEFLYLIDRDVSRETVERACHRLSGAMKFTVELETVGLSLSATIGAALFPVDGATADSLLTAADQAIYAAKNSGIGYCLAGVVADPGGVDGPDGLDRARELPDPPSPAAPVDATRSIVREMRGPAAGVDEARNVSVATPVAKAIGHRNENRRVERRHRVYKRGRIIFGDGFSTIDCTIRDLSTRGARIAVEDQLTVPPRFSFAILDTGEVHSAVRRWQRGRSIGVEFMIGVQNVGA